MSKIQTYQDADWIYIRTPTGTARLTADQLLAIAGDVDNTVAFIPDFPEIGAEA